MFLPDEILTVGTVGCLEYTKWTKDKMLFLRNFPMLTVRSQVLAPAQWAYLVGQ
jgi:hypothetical protein